MPGRAVPRGSDRAIPRDGDGPVELNTALMASTFRIASQRGPIGTAFVLGVPAAAGRPAGLVLVTSAHLLGEIPGDSATLWLRRAVRPSGWKRRPVALRIRAHGRPRWVEHPRADVAVMRVALPRGTIREVVPASLLADDAALVRHRVHPGDELNCLGFPFGAESSRAGFPILRSGKIASYPLLPTRRTRVFLLDFRVFRGNSGGPVYLAESREHPAGSPRIGRSARLIVGLVSREVMVTERIQELYGTREQSYTLGLAEVVHASLIRQALELLPGRPRASGSGRRQSPSRTGSTRVVQPGEGRRRPRSLARRRGGRPG